MYAYATCRKGHCEALRKQLSILSPFLPFLNSCKLRGNLEGLLRRYGAHRPPTMSLFYCRSRWSQGGAGEEPTPAFYRWGSLLVMLGWGSVMNSGTKMHVCSWKKNTTMEDKVMRERIQPKPKDHNDINRMIIKISCTNDVISIIESHPVREKCSI